MNSYRIFLGLRQMLIDLSDWIVESLFWALLAAIVSAVLAYVIAEDRAKSWF